MRAGALVVAREAKRTAGNMIMVAEWARRSFVKTSVSATTKRCISSLLSIVFGGSSGLGRPGE